MTSTHPAAIVSSPTPSPVHLDVATVETGDQVTQRAVHVDHDLGHAVVGDELGGEVDVLTTSGRARRLETLIPGFAGVDPTLPPGASCRSGVSCGKRPSPDREGPISGGDGSRLVDDTTTTRAGGTRGRHSRL